MSDSALQLTTLLRLEGLRLTAESAVKDQDGGALASTPVAPLLVSKAILNECVRSASQSQDPA